MMAAVESDALRGVELRGRARCLVIIRLFLAIDALRPLERELVQQGPERTALG